MRATSKPQRSSTRRRSDSALSSPCNSTPFRCPTRLPSFPNNVIAQDELLGLFSTASHDSAFRARVAQAVLQSRISGLLKATVYTASCLHAVLLFNGVIVTRMHLAAADPSKTRLRRATIAGAIAPSEGAVCCRFYFYLPQRVKRRDNCAAFCTTASQTQHSDFEKRSLPREYIASHANP